jgi:hypothetical protein
VFWRAALPEAGGDASRRRRPAVRREELCNVPISSFRSEFLGTGKTAYRFDYLDGAWRPISKKDGGSVIPGQLFCVVADTRHPLAAAPTTPRRILRLGRVVVRGMEDDRRSHE